MNFTNRSFLSVCIAPTFVVYFAVAIGVGGPEENLRLLLGQRLAHTGQSSLQLRGIHKAIFVYVKYVERSQHL